jgi:hypothetical protein
MVYTENNYKKNNKMTKGKNYMPRDINAINFYLDNRTDKTKLSLSHFGLTEQDIQEWIIPLLNEHPEIKELDVSFNNIGADGAKALAANTTLTTLNVDGNNIGEAGEKALHETDPVKRASYGRAVGMKTEVPSLKRIALFKVQQSPQLDKNKLPEELIEELKKPKV